MDEQIKEELPVSAGLKQNVSPRRRLEQES
jgi:hypothetical protein